MFSSQMRFPTQYYKTKRYSFFFKNAGAEFESSQNCNGVCIRSRKWMISSFSLHQRKIAGLVYQYGKSGNFSFLGALDDLDEIKK